MQKHDREQLNTQNQRNYTFLRFRKGCKAVFTDWKKTIIFVAYVLSAVWFIDIEILHHAVNEIQAISSIQIVELLEVLQTFEQSLIQFGIVLFAPIGGLLLLVALGTPIGSKKIRDNLLRIGLDNHAGEAPLLIGKTKSKTDKRIVILEFITHGLPLNKWEDMKLEIEATLNLNVVKIETGVTKHHVLLHTIPARYNLPDKINWTNSQMVINQHDGFILSLGESLLGVETVDLSRTPHILLGGSTGSGKSVLLKLLLMQCVKKGAIVTITDFKGGVDFPSTWHKHCKIITDENILLVKLEELTQELESRKSLLAKSGYPNIDEYVRYTKEYLPRLVFACDEVAELLDKTGLDKDQKAVIASIESKLSKLARLGRAFGIHLILATQRPDANVLSGQIKNNIDFRACGRADNTLSIIILDNGSASDQIPSDAQGRFITREGTVFQAYWFDEKISLV